MAGRGYTAEGAHHAADFIAGYFSSFHLENFHHTYRQTFTLDVNVFDGKMMLVAGTDTLKPGKDFIINCASSGGNGNLKIKNLPLKIDSQSVIPSLPKNPAGKCWVVDESVIADKQLLQFSNALQGGRMLESSCLIELRNKIPAMDVEHSAFLPPWFVVRKDAWPADAKKISFVADEKVLKDYPADNLIGFVPGTAQPDSFIVFTAHYDHLGQMGTATYFPGANDNASGIAMILTLAKYFSEHPQKYSVAFIAFAGEEAGLLGSQFFVKHPWIALQKIKFLTNLDIVGTGDEGIKVVNATEFKLPFDTLVSINNRKNYLKLVSPRGKAANSDHYFFSEAGVPAFFIYTMGGISAYHDVFDRPETLPLTEFEDLFHLLIDFTGSF